MLWLTAVVMAMAPYTSAVEHVNDWHAEPLGTLPVVEWVDHCIHGNAWYLPATETIRLCRGHDWGRSAAWGLTLEVALRHELTHALQHQTQGVLFFGGPQWTYEGWAEFVAYDGDCARASYYDDCVRFADARRSR